MSSTGMAPDWGRRRWPGDHLRLAVSPGVSIPASAFVYPVLQTICKADENMTDDQILKAIPGAIHLGTVRVGHKGPGTYLFGVAKLDKNLDADLRASAEALGRRSLRRTTVRAGAPIQETVMTVSPDGRTLTSRRPGSSDLPAIVTYEKQR
jgi:hypothetical protein